MKTFAIGFNYKCVVGDYTYGYEHIEVVLSGANINIGKFCSIAPGVKAFLGLNHRTDWITTYPFGDRYTNVFNYTGPVGFKESKGDINIGNDVYVGIDSRLMSGITIGDGAVIGAHSVVAKDIPPYCVAVGNPARVVKKRFTDEEIFLLLNLKWWDLPPEKINKLIPFLNTNDVAGLLKKALTLN